VSGVHRWLKGPFIPPAPGSRTAGTSKPASPQPPPAAAAEPQAAQHASAVGSSWRGTAAQAPAAAAAATADSQQQQQQQQQPVLWPASSYAWGPSVVSRLGSSSFGYGHFLGTYIPSTLSTQQQQQQLLLGGSSSSSASVHTLGRPAASGPLAAAAGGPLLSTPVLPAYPLPCGSSSTSVQPSDTQQLSERVQGVQQHYTQLLQPLKVKRGKQLVGGHHPHELQLVLSCTYPGLQQQQQQQEPLLVLLLVCEQSTAEEVTSGRGRRSGSLYWGVSVWHEMTGPACSCPCWAKRVPQCSSTP